MSIGAFDQKIFHKKSQEAPWDRCGAIKVMARLAARFQWVPLSPAQSHGVGQRLVVRWRPVGTPLSFEFPNKWIHHHETARGGPPVDAIKVKRNAAWAEMERAGDLPAPKPVMECSS